MKNKRCATCGHHKYNHLDELNGGCAVQANALFNPGPLPMPCSCNKFKKRKKPSNNHGLYLCQSCDVNLTSVYRIEIQQHKIWHWQGLNECCVCGRDTLYQDDGLGNAT